MIKDALIYSLGTVLTLICILKMLGCSVFSCYLTSLLAEQYYTVHKCE